MVVLPRRCQPLQPPVEKQLLRSQPSHHLQEKAFRRPVIPLHLPTQAPTWPLQRQHMILTEHKAAINMEQMQTLLGLCTTNNSNTISKGNGISSGLATRVKPNLSISTHRLNKAMCQMDKQLPRLLLTPQQRPHQQRL
ncbi:hypothetical protein WJX75_009219 [Coccomyxa subellipsoidea]|uniref:Uncharacterized protein n=1 Tax=Coccomyxa subellipsoidea TaxID=248742 RepID=A0ABR2YRL9_9CHLO